VPEDDVFPIKRAMDPDGEGIVDEGRWPFLEGASWQSLYVSVSV
jgi:hypothetical protein